MTDDIKDMSFEECLRELETKVRLLEEGNKDLDESLRIYEEAIELRKRCKQYLDESERKVQKLMETAGELEKRDFNVL